MRVCSGSPITRLHRVTLILCIQWISTSTLHMSAVSTASWQLSKCGANVAVISKEFPGLPIVRMLEAWVVLQWHTETDGVGIAALLQSARCVMCMLRVPSCGQLCSYWFMFPLLADCSTAEYGHCTAECTQH